MKRVLIRGGRVLDPSQGWDRTAHLLIADGRIAAVDEGLSVDAEEIIDATHCLVVPGLIDVGTELREPGFEEDETIATGSASAVRGGYTCVACLPNTDPPIDSQASVEFVQHQAARARHCQVVVLACVSRNRAGQELSEMGLLAEAGAVGFSDAPSPVSNTELMRRALEYSQMFGRTIINRPESPELTRDSVMHEGWVSTLLGLSGIPAAAEDVMTARDLHLLESTGGRLHLLHLSTKGSVELVRRAKRETQAVTAGIAIANLVLSDEALRSFDTHCKVNPPLRSADHVEACIEGLRDGTIDVISSAHSPRAPEKKMDVLDAAPFGMVGLETTLGLVGSHLVGPGHLSWLTAIAKLSCLPAQILGLTNKGTLRIGADADVTIIDPQATWHVNPQQFRSKSINTPFAGWALHGRATHVIVGGHIRLREGECC